MHIIFPCTYGLFPSAGVIKGSLHKSRSRQELQERQITCWGKFPTNDNYHKIILILLFQRAGIEVHKFCSVHSFWLYLECIRKFKIYALWFILINLLQFAHLFSQGYNIIMAREAKTLKGRCTPVVGYQIKGEFKQ